MLLEALRTGIHVISECHSLAFVRFVSSSYWPRLLIIQEILLASNETYILAGGEIILFEAMHRTMLVIKKYIKILLSATYLTSYDLTELATELENSALVQVSAIANIRQVMRNAKWAIEHAEFVLSPLGLSRQAIYSDPRDRVYGILGLISPVQADKITVNYEMPAEVVNTSFAASLVEHTGSLNILTLCRNTHRNLGRMKSWVLALQNEKGPLPFGSFSASANMGHLGKPTIDSDIRLAVPGICIDWVDGLLAVE